MQGKCLNPPDAQDATHPTGAERGPRPPRGPARVGRGVCPPSSEPAPSLGGPGLGGGGVPVRNLTSLVPVAEALQSDIDRDLHLLVYANVLQPLGPASAPRAARSGAAPAARSGRPRGDAARPGHGPEKFSPRGRGQACQLAVNDEDRRPPPGLDRSADCLRWAGVTGDLLATRSPQQPRRSRRHWSPGKAGSAGVMTSPGPRAPVTSARQPPLAPGPHQDYPDFLSSRVPPPHASRTKGLSCILLFSHLFFP